MISTINPSMIVEFHAGTKQYGLSASNDIAPYFGHYDLKQVDPILIKIVLVEKPPNNYTDLENPIIIEEET